MGVELPAWQVRMLENNVNHNPKATKATRLVVSVCVQAAPVSIRLVVPLAATLLLPLLLLRAAAIQIMHLVP
jgi:hypothetical protein